MRTENQVALVKEFMLRIAPTTAWDAAHHLTQMAGHDPETIDDFRHRVAKTLARTTLEFASHMAAQFASYEYEALDAVEAQEAAAASQQKAQAAAEGILPEPSGLPAEPQSLRGLPPERINPGPPSSRTGRRGT